jgi:2-polyprenyl-3-methyl-5-hydroxy-6-metoxy-1,4-benzoquinol methylase
MFKKMDFDYEECLSCGTLFVNPRPDSETFKIFYQNSASVDFWATHFYKETEDARRREIIRPKALLVKSFIDKYCENRAENPAIIDIGAGYGVFCEEIKGIIQEKTSVIAIEPAKSLQEICKKKGLFTIPKFLDDITDQDLQDYSIIAATSFELLEHLHDPESFIKDCKKILKPGSLLILTTLNWHGFDLQTLREKSKSIHPPHHINFFTPQSLSHLLEQNGFSPCEIITPGKLDVDIVAKQIEDIKDPFIRRLIMSDELTQQKFQKFLQDTCMSSHMMIVAKRCD